MKKTTRVGLLAFCVAAATLGARADFRDERRNAAYKSAMADYAAGRLDEATATFERVIRADGENASARFQLACLMQDHRHDYLGAVCQYREYLRLEPGSDKAPLARDRMAICEEELAKQLAERHGLLSTRELNEECERLKARAAESDAAKAKTEKALAAAETRASGLQEENERLRRMLARFGETVATDNSTGPRKMDRPDISDVVADEQSAAGPEGFVTNAAELGIGDEADDEPIGRSLAEAKAIADELAEEDDAAPVLLDNSAPPARESLTQFAASRSSEKTEDRPPERPATYLVQDGDTLYKIALRFYGKTAAWKQIRDANKATISTDGRVQSGQTIVLP